MWIERECDMNDMVDNKMQTPIEWDGQVVITTAQLADVYGASTDNIKDNFNRNKDRFVNGKHYILLTGNDLRQFKNQVAETNLVDKRTSQLYLWTRRGASRHCKILGTDKAWEQFDYLEDNYFEKKPQPKLPQTPMELLELHYEAIKQVDSKVNTLEERFNDFEQSLPLLPEDADDISKEVKKRVVEVLGGKDSNAYHDKSLSQKVFMDAYKNLKSNFDVSSYKAIKRNRKDVAVQIAREYKPPLYLAEQIQAENAQMKLF